MIYYVIIDSSDIDSMNFDSLIGEVAGIRRNLDGTKAIVKYEGRKPGFLYGKDKYTKSQIQAIMNDYDEGWNLQDEE